MTARITIDLTTDPYALNKIMEIDHVILVNDDGTVTHPVEGVFAPEVNLDTTNEGDILFRHEAAMVDSLREQGWEPETGWTGQYMAGSTPIMHASEFTGGDLAAHILETPGYWVALAVDVESTECEPGEKDCTLNGPRCDYCARNGRATVPAGWMVAYREAEES